MEDNSIQTALPVAKLRSIKHYVNEIGTSEILFCEDLASRLEKFDTIIGPQEFKKVLEETLKERIGRFSPESESTKNLMNMIRLYFLEIIGEAVLPENYLIALKMDYTGYRSNK